MSGCVRDSVSRKNAVWYGHLAISGDQAPHPIGRGVTLEMVINARQSPSRAALKKNSFNVLTTVRDSFSLYYYN